MTEKHTSLWSESYHREYRIIWRKRMRKRGELGLQLLQQLPLHKRSNDSYYTNKEYKYIYLHLTFEHSLCVVVQVFKDLFLCHGPEGRTWVVGASWRSLHPVFWSTNWLTVAVRRTSKTTYYLKSYYYDLACELMWKIFPEAWCTCARRSFFEIELSAAFV